MYYRRLPQWLLQRAGSGGAHVGRVVDGISLCSSMSPGGMTSTSRGNSSSMFTHPSIARRVTSLRSFASSNDHKGGSNGDDTLPPSNVLSDDWIPPSRPLAGDQGGAGNFRQQKQVVETAQALEEALFVIDDNDSEEEIQRKLVLALKLEEELEQQEFQQALEFEKDLERRTIQQQQQPDISTHGVDWLATRRKTLGKNEETTKSSVPVREFELMTKDELTTFLEFHKGVDVQVLLDNPNAPRMGGADGMIVCGASSIFHLQVMTKSLIDHLKERRLQERGVLGAQMNSNQFSPRNSKSHWNVVDCQNYIVHFLDEPTRRALKLEHLWSGKDPLWSLDIRNEDAVDQYVAQHPVPADYGFHSAQALWDISKLERNQFVPHTPVVSSLQKQNDRRAGRRKRREMRQGSSYP